MQLQAGHIVYSSKNSITYRVCSIGHAYTSMEYSYTGGRWQRVPHIVACTPQECVLLELRYAGQYCTYPTEQVQQAVDTGTMRIVQYVKPENPI